MPVTLRRASLLLAVLVPVILIGTPRAATADTTGNVSARSVNVFPQATDLGATRLPISGKNLTGKSVITVSRNGTTLWSTTTNKRNYGYITVPRSALQTWPGGRYTLTVTSGNTTAKSRVQVHRGWAPLLQDASGNFTLVRYPRCSKLTWSYDATNAPKDTTGIIDDFTTVFDRYSALTGMTITQAGTGQTGDIVVNWADLGNVGDGTGGSSYRGTTFLAGTVTLNTRSEWAKTPGLGEYERGGLLYHEVGHVLGLGHVNVDTTLMNPITIIGHTNNEPGPNEIRALNFLYAPKKCA